MVAILLYEIFPPKLKLTNSNNRSAAISEAGERKMILKCPEDLRFTSLDMRWKHPLFFWDWFWLVRLRMVPIMCKISAGSTVGGSFCLFDPICFYLKAHAEKKAEERTWRADSKSGPCGGTVRRPPEMDMAGWWRADGQSVQRRDYKILQVNILKVSFTECTKIVGGQGQGVTC